ncbi:DNA-directed RNA polymerase I subunit RPA34.5-domain-containing protein [Aspergillus desertorum]
MAAKPVKEPKKARETRSESISSSSAESNSRAGESSSSSSEGEQSDSSDNESAASSGEKSESQNEDSAQKISKPRTFGAPRQYKPPFGFKSAKNQPSSSTTTSALSNLAGKQVFHITAPAFLPLSKVKEVSLAGALKGEPILKHGGVNYGIPPDSLTHAQAGASGQSLFLYDAKTQTYYSTVTNIPTYRIQEMVELPGVAELEEAIVRSAKAMEKQPRKQPKHLKMRFRPVGSGEAPPETLGSSSEESEGEEHTMKMPLGLEKEKERKRKHQQTEGDGGQAASLPRKKSKKHSGDLEAGEGKSKKSKDRDGKKRKKEKV